MSGSGRVACLVCRMRDRILVGFPVSRSRFVQKAFARDPWAIFLVDL